MTGVIHTCLRGAHSDNLLPSFFLFSCCVASPRARLHVCSVIRYRAGRMAETCPFWCDVFVEGHYPNYSQPPQLTEGPLFTCLLSRANCFSVFVYRSSVLLRDSIMCSAQCLCDEKANPAFLTEALETVWLQDKRSKRTIQQWHNVKHRKLYSSIYFVL